MSTQTASDDQVVKFWDELSLVGLPDDIDVQALFEPTGKMCHCSPLWLLWVYFSSSISTVATMAVSEVCHLLIFGALLFIKCLMMLSCLLPTIHSGFV